MSKKHEAPAERRNKHLAPMQLSDKIRLAAFQFDPPASPGRGKRRVTLDEPDGLRRLEIMEAVCNGNDVPQLQKEIAASLRSGSKSIFHQIIQVMEEIENRNDSQFSKRVIACLRAKIKLTDELGRLPTKTELKTEVGRMEGLQNKIDLETFATAEPERWTEIFRSANLTRLPKGKAQRGQSRRGNQ